MPLLESKVDRKSAEFAANDGGACARWWRNCAPGRRRCATGGGEAARAKHVARGKLLPRDRVEMLLDPGHAVPRAVAAGGLRHVRRRIARRRHHHRHRPHRRPRMRDRVQRPDGEGRHLLPGHHQEAPARAARGRGEPAAVRLSGGFGRRAPAQPGRSVPRRRSTSAASSSTRPTCRRPAFRRSRWSWARARRAARTCRR